MISHLILGWIKQENGGLYNRIPDYLVQITNYMADLMHDFQTPGNIWQVDNLFYPCIILLQYVLPGKSTISRFGIGQRR